MKRLSVLLGLAALMGGTALAQDMASMEDLFPAMPCHDGWAACLVDGDEVSPEPRRDAAGRPLPADMRVGWFDLQATSAFDPFQGLSVYTGELSGGGGDATADLIEDGPEDPPTVEDEPEADDDTGERQPTEFPEVEPEPEIDNGGDFGSNGGDFGEPMILGTHGGTKGSDPEPDRFVEPEPEPDRFVEPEPEPEPVVVEPEPEPEPKQIEPEPEPEPAVVEVDPEVEPEPEPKQVGGNAVKKGCDNLVTLEPSALMGKLSGPQAACLEGRISSSSSQTDKDKISRVLLANAEASGNKKEWERLMRRHLEDIDRSDPNLCFKYALHLSRGGASRAWGVIKWADYALENKSQWSGTTYKTRVYSLYQLKAEASMKLWEAANTELIEAGGDNRDELTAKEEKLRGMAKDFAREWLDYARASGQDTKKPMSNCVTAAGSKKYCQDK
jgi:hypothetical protein